MTLPLKTLGGRADRIYELRQAKKNLNKTLEAINKELTDLETEFLEAADEQGTTTAAGSAASVSISETVVPNVEDWDALYKYIHDNDAFYLLQRRVGSAAFRELMADGEEVPGVKPVPIRTISVRKISK